MADNRHQTTIVQLQRQLLVLPLCSDNTDKAAAIGELGAAHYGASRANRRH